MKVIELSKKIDTYSYPQCDVVVLEHAWSSSEAIVLYRCGDDIFVNIWEQYEGSDMRKDGYLVAFFLQVYDEKKGVDEIAQGFSEDSRVVYKWEDGTIICLEERDGASIWTVIGREGSIRGLVVV